jgi:tRNA 5-methylaminomethyl-2-thiouridine biosynthesis bifunctional protein
MCLTGLGSRGLTTAPLLAEIAVSQLLKQALPMQNELLDALNPNRFLVRSLIRRQDY